MAGGTRHRRRVPSSAFEGGPDQSGSLTPDSLGTTNPFNDEVSLHTNQRLPSEYATEYGSFRSASPNPETEPEPEPEPEHELESGTGINEKAEEAEVQSKPGADADGQVRPKRPRGPPTYFHSRRVQKGEIDQPWLREVDPKEKWVTIIPIIGLLIGLLISGYLVWDGIHSVVRHNYCQVLSEDFSGGLNTNIWTKEAEVGGFGNGQFEQTTLDDENVFVEDGKLIIRPTLQDEKLLTANSVLNLTADGTCSSKHLSDCVSITNTTTHEIMQPVKSGRINTKKGATIKYGRVEVTAKMPTGDWLWPAIWMLSVNDSYGAWPLSGEIDIAESRGNNHTYTMGGNDIMSSTLHWGPDSDNDGWWRMNMRRTALHSTYAEREHTFGLEWSQKYLFTYIDSKLMQVIYTKFDQPLWKRGQFPDYNSNGTRIADVWSQTGRDATPFDQEFYLILNVAVGGTNGWFQDGLASKPWADNSPTAKYDFYNAQNDWLPTWRKPGAGQMEISKVEMWQQCDGDENNE